MDTLKHVDWVNMEKFMQQQTPISRCNIIQMVHNWQNTESQKQKFYDSGNTHPLGESNNTDIGDRLGKCPLGCNNRELPFTL